MFYRGETLDSVSSLLGLNPGYGTAAIFFVAAENCLPTSLSTHRT